MSSDQDNMPKFGKLKRLGEDEPPAPEPEPQVTEEYFIPDEQNDYQEEDFQVVENVPAPPKPPVPSGPAPVEPL